MSDIPVALRRIVIRRADNRCEYCGLSQVGQEATFHIDHIVPVIAGGRTISDNLALACVSCSLRKGASRTAVDPESGSEVHLFNPRETDWREHFRWQSIVVVGLSAIGRATIVKLDMNRSLIQAIRHEEELFGRHPPNSASVS